MRKYFAGLMLVACLGLAGCTGDSSKVSQPSGNEVPASEETLAALKKADALDGKEDKVVGKCYCCGLGMDGKAEFAELKYGYTSHLCSAACQKHFHDNADKVIAGTKVPTASEPATH